MVQEFYSAVMARNNEKAKVMWLNNKITPDARIVHGAIGVGNFDILKFMVERGADLDLENELGQTALEVAVIEEQAEVVATLLQLGFDPNGTHEGVPLLHFALDKKLLEITSLLLSHRANPDVPDIEGRLPLTKVLHRGIFERGTTRQKKIALARTLIPYADVNRPDASGRLALHMAADYDRGEVVEELFERNADPDLFDDRGESPLMTAIRRGHSDIAMAIIPHADVNSAGALGEDGPTFCTFARGRGGGEGTFRGGCRFQYSRSSWKDPRYRSCT